MSPVPIALLLASIVALASSQPLAVCTQIATALPDSVFYPGTPEYAEDISHWASSNQLASACSVRPSSAEDAGTAISIIGNDQTSFAVKGGGHATNPTFSSTTGVHISMARFSDVVYDSASQTATIGAGLIWDDVYAALEPIGVNVVGGRVTGVGVAGFTLGGGYSWKSNQLGLTIDTVTAFELVLPNGNVTTVTQTSDPDLFFGLRGGGNNFGIVTRFTLQTFPQTEVWGGLITYTESQLAAVTAAVDAFANNVTDPKAAIITAYNFLLGEPGVSHIMFYDAPTPPSGIFDTFLAIPHLSMDVSTRSFSSLVQSSPSNATYGMRGTFNTISTPAYTTALLDAIVNETIFWGNQLSAEGAFFISYDVEPFTSSLTTHSPAPAAYTPVGMPLNIYYAWPATASDSVMYAAARTSAARLQQVAGTPALPRYPNYAIFDTPLADMYGTNSVARLQALKARVDPGNVMGVAGGFKF